jgi:hypothetical protein
MCLFANATEKRALIVAIGTYPTNSGWPNISSANDAILMRTTLQSQDFNAKNITTLADDKATKANIIRSLENLIAQSTVGDAVVFHFSGHGQQIADQNGDELDDYDEALIPYDAQKLVSAKYHGENHLRDDELNRFLFRLREKIGPTGDVLFLLDACHSGTATRGTNDGIIYRGTDVPFGSTAPADRKNPGNSGIFNEQQNSTYVGQDNLAPFIVISGIHPTNSVLPE